MAAHAFVKTALIGACALFAAGCGTLAHQLSSTMTVFPPGGPPAYGGLETDLRALDKQLNAPRTPASVAATSFVALDMPFSAAADTLLLPFWAIENIGRPQKMSHPETVAKNVEIRTE